MCRLFVVLLTVCLAIATADNQGNGKGKGKGHKGKDDSPAASVDIRFGTNDVHVIQQYYGAHPVNLPPGLQKKLARGKPLPPGWQKKLQPFPHDVDSRLVSTCDYCGRGVVDGYGVLYDKKTAVILDIVQLTSDILR
jgi:hypothetical protein